MHTRTNTIVSVLPIVLLLSLTTARADEIHDAARDGDVEKVRYLLENNNELLQAADLVAKTPLHHAIESGNTDIARYLIAQGADINLKDKDSASALHCAASLGDPEIVELLLKKGATGINESDFRDCTPLFIASMNGHPEVVELLLDYGADIDAGDEIGRTPLMISGRGGNMKVVEILVDRGADINANIMHDSNEYTVLTVCAWYGFVDVVDYLIDRNAEIPETALESTFHSAISSGMYRLYEHVKKQGLDMAALKDADPDLIFTASSGGSSEIFESLIRHGFDPNLVDKDGWTPLHYAASAGKREIVEYIVGSGLDKNARNMKGETAYNLAMSAGVSDVADFLRSAGADQSEPEFPQLTGPYMGQKPPDDTPEMFLPGIVSGRHRAHSSIAFSPDGREAYWTEMSPPEGGVMGMEMVGGRWTSPKPSSMLRDPSFSPDGERLYYIEVRPFKKGEISAGETNGWECYWYTQRTDSGWSEPVSVGDAVNSIGVHWPCSIDRDGNLYFSEFANNMYFSEFRDGEYQEPVNLVEKFKNETLQGRSPFISPDGDYLLFSTKEGICVSFRQDDGSWTDRVDLGDQINSTHENGCPRVTPDGKYIFFVSAGQNRPWGIYWVSSSTIERLR